MYVRVSNQSCNSQVKSDLVVSVGRYDALIAAQIAALAAIIVSRGLHAKDPLHPQDTQTQEDTQGHLFLHTHFEVPEKSDWENGQHQIFERPVAL